MAFWNWSRTAATNATADPTIVWSEGQAPSSVNDSARAMMARTAEWRDDISGTITTTGTSTAYRLISNQGFTSLANMNGAMIAFIPHVTNGSGTVFLDVDGLGSHPLRGVNFAELGSGVIIQGSPYVMTYNAADAVWYLQGFYGNPFNIPIGGLMPYLGTSAPNSNFVLPFGQALSRTVYSTLFTLCSVGGVPIFGNGTGGDGTTFGVPDLRGRAVFGQDNMGGSAAGIITAAGGNFDGTVRGATGGAQNKTVAQGNLPSVSLTTTITDLGHGHDIGGGPNNSGASAVSFTSNTGSSTISAGGNAVKNAQTGITASTALGGSGTPLPILPPAMVLPYILRVI